MGRFQNLSQVSRVIADVIGNAVPAGTDVVINVPPENPESAQPAVRVSLLWTTPQPGHRSDDVERNPDGTVASAPATLTAWYLVSTYGQAPDSNAIDAHNLLGDVVRAFHATATLTLPVNANGEGVIDVVQVPVDHELCEKVWVPLQARLRPWAVFDVGPIQLLRNDPPANVQPIVHPGGVRLADIDVADRPRITRLVPSTIGVGGRVRIDGSYTGAPTRVTIGDERLVPPDIVAMEAGGPVLVTLTNAIVAGDFTVTLTGVGPASSDPEVLSVVPETVPSVDAPDVLQHSRAAALVLNGRALGVGAVQVFFWPDSGISAPTEVVTVAGTAANTTVTIQPAALGPLHGRLYRISVHLPPHTFTPHVLLEVVP
jgi:hypothetical protein